MPDTTANLALYRLSTDVDNPVPRLRANFDTLDNLIPGRTEETSIAADDYVLIWDTSAVAYRKMRRDNFVSGLGSSTTFASPTAQVVLTAIPGTSLSAMRADAAPALSQAIQPTWTNPHTFNAGIVVAGSNIKLNSGATANEEYMIAGRVSLGFPVPYLTPTQNNKLIAFDIFPKGTPGDFGATIGPAWVDICSTDIVADGGNYECLRLTKLSNGVGHIGTAKGGTGTVRDLALQLNGGNVGVGTTTITEKLEVAGAIRATSLNASTSSTLPWYSAYSFLQVGGNGAVSADTGRGSGNGITVSQNAYLNTSVAWTYTSTAAATRYLQLLGFHIFQRAVSGTAGAAISWVEVMRLDSSSNLGLNTTTPRAQADFLSTSQAQLRLTYTDNSVYANFTVDSSGNLTIAPTGPLISLSSTTRLQSSNYASQTTGWSADGTTGAGDFRYIYSDELHTKSFIADLEQALAGGQIISKSVAEINANFTLPAAGGAATLTVKDLPSASGMAVFESGDIIRLRQFSRASGSLTIADAWGVVTSRVDNGNGTQSWTFTRSSGARAGTASGTINAKTLSLDYGVSGNGFYEVNAVDGAYGVNGPYAQIVTYTTHPQDGQVVRARLGNLKGVTGVTEYGLYAGDATGGTLGSSNKYLRITDANAEFHNIKLDLYEGANRTISLDPSGPYLALGNSMPTSYLQASTAGVWMGNAGSSTYKVRIGTTNGSSVLTAGLTWDGSTLAVIGGITATSGAIAGPLTLSGSTASFQHSGIRSLEFT